MSNTRCEKVTLIGAYVLGHLGGREASELARHIGGCGDCSAEALELEPVARALVTAGPVRGDLDDRPEVPSDRVERGLFARVEAEVRRTKRTRRTRVAAVAAALVIVGGGSALAVVSARDTRTDGPVFEITAAVGTGDGVSGSVRVWEKPWGSYARIDAIGLPPGETFGLWFEERGGSRVPMGSFVGTGKEPIHCVGVAATQLKNAVAVGATNKYGKDVFRANLADLALGRLDDGGATRA